MRRRVAVLIPLFLVVATRDAHAYIDPAAGNMILQLIIGGVAGLFVTFKLFKERIVGIFRRGRRLAPGE